MLLHLLLVARGTGKVPLEAEPLRASRAACSRPLASFSRSTHLHAAGILLSCTRRSPIDKHTTHPPARPQHYSRRNYSTPDQLITQQNMPTIEQLMMLMTSLVEQ